MERSPEMGESAAPRWNLFARTLEELLRAHNETPLTMLDNLRERPGEELDPSDPESPRELVHREKVRRLGHSLQQPGNFTTLNRDDLERISRYFRFSENEQLRLRAAMLAATVQRTVYERVGNCDTAEQQRVAARLALRAAEALLPTFIEALGELDDDGMSAFRGGGGALAGGTPMQNPQTPMDAQSDDPHAAVLAGALDALDRATLALTLSYSAPGSAERLERARAARDAFSATLERLDDHPVEVRASESWRIWHAEARRGYDEADERVIDLGG